MILVDTSVWIEYFRGNEKARALDTLIETNSVVTNNLILSELLPFIIHRKEFNLKNLLSHIEKIEIDIDWPELIKMQTVNLANGINKVGIPDLIIAQNAIQNNLYLYTLDKHFILMSPLFGIKSVY